MTRLIQPFTTLENFLFNTPLYEPLRLTEETFKILYGSPRQKIDGHCPMCRDRSTFTVEYDKLPLNITPLKYSAISEDIVLTCARQDSHRLRYRYALSNELVEKWGQRPSLATISNDEVAQYRKTMKPQDSAEFHKAIGLASHGVGVGSFVYFRRVFERLIDSRYREFKEAEGWNDQDFYSLRMNDRVNFLKGHLPNFLVENAKIYSILSAGIHELSEDECLSYFEVLKHSIIVILDEDKRKIEELAKREALSKAIAAIGGSNNS